MVGNESTVFPVRLVWFLSTTLHWKFVNRLTKSNKFCFIRFYKEIREERGNNLVLEGNVE